MAQYLFTVAHSLTKQFIFCGIVTIWFIILGGSVALSVLAETLTLLNVQRYQ